MTDILPPAAVSPDKRPWLTRRAWWAGVGGGAAVLIAYLAISNATFTMNGTYTSGVRTSDWSSAYPCDTLRTPTQGADVTITDKHGDVVGRGTLGQGVAVLGYRCEYSFTVEDVPYSGGPFLVKVEDVDPVAFDVVDAREPHIETPVYYPVYH